jgi:hypothetical protein
VTAVSSGDHENRETATTTLVPAACARSRTASKTDPFQARQRESCRSAPSAPACRLKKTSVETAEKSRVSRA